MQATGHDCSVSFIAMSMTVCLCNHVSQDTRAWGQEHERTMADASAEHSSAIAQLRSFAASMQSASDASLRDEMSAASLLALSKAGMEHQRRLQVRGMSEGLAA